MDTKKLITLFVIAGTGLLAICTGAIVLFVLLLPDPVESSRSPPGQPDASSSYTGLCDQANGSTEAQWESRFEQEIKGRPVTWSGEVTEVFQDASGAYHAWVNLGHSFSGNDVRLNDLNPDTALSLNKDQPVEFSGTIDYFGHLCVAGLVDVQVTNARIQ